MPNAMPSPSHHSLNAAALSDDVQDKWQRVLHRLRAEVGDAVYNSWFVRLELVGLANGYAQLSVPTKFLKTWIQRHYAERICAALDAEIGDVKSIDIDVRTSLRNSVRVVSQAPQPASAVETVAEPAPAPVAATSAMQEDASGFSGSPLDRRMTFDNFLVGTSNQLAHAAAHRVGAAKSGEPVMFNPLFVHANVGLGKTHVIQAIAHAAAAAGRRVIYLSAEKFMYGFVAALRAQNAVAFKEKMRAIDLLIIDDIQFLQGKVIQQEFCHTLNALLDVGTAGRRRFGPSAVRSRKSRRTRAVAARRRTSASTSARSTRNCGSVSCSRGSPSHASIIRTSMCPRQSSPM